MGAWRYTALAHRLGPGWFIWRRWVDQGRLARISLALILGQSVLLLLDDSRLQAALAVIRLWPDPQAQARLHLGQVPYDLLTAADSILPPQATVLLATPGSDVRHREYTTFHRALYYLTPRPVWWITPAPADGTWESRWWTSAPLTPASILAEANTRHATHILTMGPGPPPAIGTEIIPLAGGYLITLGAPSAVAGGSAAAGPVIAAWWPIRLALALGTILSLGLGLLSLGSRWQPTASAIETLSLAWLGGGLLLSLSMFWLSAVGVVLNWQVFLLSGLAVLAASRLLIRRLTSAVGGEPRPAGAGLATRAPPPPAVPCDSKEPPGGRTAIRTLATGLLLILLALQIAQVGLLATGRPLTLWDSWSSWGMKARTIFVEGSITASVYGDISRLSTHPYYPLHVPLTHAWLYSWLGQPDDRLVGSVAVVHFLALAGISYAAVRRRGASSLLALFSTVTIVSIPFIARDAPTVSADLPLTVFALAAGVFFAEYLDIGSLRSLAIGATAAGALPWIKREGFVLLAALMLAALIHGQRSGRVGRLLIASFVMAGPIAGPWWLLAVQSGPISPDFLPFTLGNFVANAGRLPTIAAFAAANLSDPSWVYLWPLAVGLLVVVAAGRLTERLGRSSRARPAVSRTALLLTTAVTYLAAMAASYVFSDFVPYEQHLLTSFFRLATQIAPMVGVWMAGVTLGGEPAGWSWPKPALRHSASRRMGPELRP